jgi:hypothetical protein
VSRFINANKFLADGSPLEGFVEVLVEGATPLYKRTEIAVIKPNYRQEFDMGSKDTKLIKKRAFFTAKGHDLLKLNTNNTKKLKRSLNEHQSKIDAFTSSAEFDPDKEDDLIQLFQYLNSN